jgi:hypothetical protein
VAGPRNDRPRSVRCDWIHEGPKREYAEGNGNPSAYSLFPPRTLRSALFRAYAAGFDAMTASISLERTMSCSEVQAARIWSCVYPAFSAPSSYSMVEV